ncbi:DUF975 family protein [Paenibacillus agricola]|uniref:DUF975 family protein n=1 Tax=Paenibacillus agricola TaxID=2716264 RepID=A0ABX0JEZ5_9BACL|nr:DUF975 family protein [Paenibacillus agricola]NHN33462.1 DUF975 family protein [Paenibacillus agricola]
MWTRRELKTRAKNVLRLTYWKAFLVSLIIGFVGGNGTGGGGTIPTPIGNVFDPDLWESRGSSSYRSNTWPSTFMDVFGEAIESPYFFLVVFIIALICFIIFALVFSFRIFLCYPLEVGSRRYFVRTAQNDNNLNDIEYGFRKTKYLAIVKSMLWKDFINFLWFLLLIIPGIVKSYAYRMVPYILADNANIGYKRALELSNRMTAGQKFRMWVLDLSFIGWYLLGFIALFIGILFVMPYDNATKAELYLVLRQSALDKGDCTYEEFGLDPQ